MLNLALRDYPLVGWYILVLVFLEGLLSADNALVLALMVRHLPKDEQKRVLRYGIWGAVGFRLVAVLLSAILIRFWYFKVLGGLYLLYLAVAHFLSRGEHNADSSEAARRSSGHWEAAMAPRVLGDGDLRDRDGHRLLDRLDPGRRRHGR